MHSYHIFYFPFKWEIKGRENFLFAEQTDLDNIKWNPYTNWLEKPEITNPVEQQELYNEKNYFYEFVHPALYDTGKKNSIVKHFERKEPQQRDVSYIISKKGGKTYTLKMEALNLNLYATGVGILTFFLLNDRDDQKTPEDILNINQYGRRILPPFYADLELRGEIAQSLAISGLNGNPEWYEEDFSSYKDNFMEKKWQPACFIKYLIADLCDAMFVYPVIDDRMFVNCTYSCPDLTASFDTNVCEQSIVENQKVFEEFYLEDKDAFWYKYLFVDAGWPTCQNKEMRDELLKKQTYVRWQRYGTLYGFSRYSLVMLMGVVNQHNNYLPVHMRTLYSHMVELVLIQRASTLRFSEEITRVSNLSKESSIHQIIIEQISSLYKEYIRFVNQIYFREVTAQDQGIELYNLMSDTLKIDKYIEDLDKQLSELNQYVHLIDDKVRNKNSAYLNKIATLFLPATLIAGLFGMNAISNFGEDGEIVLWQFGAQVAFIVIVCLIAYQFIKKK